MIGFVFQKGNFDNRMTIEFGMVEAGNEKRDKR